MDTDVRVLLAYSDEVTGRTLVRGLTAQGLPVAERALDAGGLIQVARAATDGTLTVALIHSELRGFDTSLLEALAREQIGAVVVGPAPEMRLGGLARIVEETHDSAAIAEAVRLAALDGSPRRLVQTAGSASEGDGGSRRSAGMTVVVTSGHGAPGKTTLAVNLAVALAAQSYPGSDVALVDLDLRGGNVGIALGLEPRFNLFQLASALGAGQELAPAVKAELQRYRARLHVLVGLASPASMLPDITPGVVSQSLRQLAQGHAWVVADLGSTSVTGQAGPAGQSHRAALESADLILAVAEPSPLGLWNLRLALGEGGGLAPYRERVGVVLNRFHPRHHHAPSEVAAAFPDVPVLACVPHEYESTECALREQRPLVEDRRSSAAKTLKELARSLGAAVPARAARAEARVA